MQKEEARPTLSGLYFLCCECGCSEIVGGNALVTCVVCR